MRAAAQINAITMVLLSLPFLSDETSPCIRSWGRTARRNVIEFTEADLGLRKTLPEQYAELVCEIFDGKNPVRTKEVADRLGRHYHTVKTHLHLAGKRGLLKRVDRKGWLPV